MEQAPHDYTDHHHEGDYRDDIRNDARAFVLHLDMCLACHIGDRILHLEHNVNTYIDNTGKIRYIIAL